MLLNYFSQALIRKYLNQSCNIMPNWVSFGRNYPSVCLGVCRGCGRMLCCSQVRDIVRTYHQHVLAYISTLLLHMVLITDQTTFSKIYFFWLEYSSFWHEFPTMQAKPISPSVICTHFGEKYPAFKTNCRKFWPQDCSRLLDVYFVYFGSKKGHGEVGTLAKSKC